MERWICDWELGDDSRRTKEYLWDGLALGTLDDLGHAFCTAATVTVPSDTVRSDSGSLSQKSCPGTGGGDPERGPSSPKTEA